VDTQSVIGIIALGVSIITIVLLGSVVLLQNLRDRLHIVFFALSLSGAFWILTNLVYKVVEPSGIKYVAALLSYGVAGFAALFFLLFCIRLARARVARKTLYIITAIGIITSIASSLPNSITTGVTEDSGLITNMPSLAAYGIYVFSYLGGGLILLLRAQKRSKGIERIRMSIILLGLLGTAIVGMFFNLALPLMGDYRFVYIGPMSTLIFVSSCTYAIVRHQLFDIKPAVVRTVAYTCSLLTLSLVYYLLAYVFSTLIFSGQMTDSISVSPVNIFLALILAFLFQPIKRFFDSATNRIFYKATYKSEDFFAEISRLLSSTIDLRGLLERAANELTNTFKVEQAMFFLYYEKEGKQHFMSAGTRGYSHLPIHDARMLDDFVTKTNESIILTYFIGDIDENVRKMLVSHKVALVMPLWQGDKITGYVLMGDKLSGSYTKHDLSVIRAIRDELVIAIQNALSLYEVKELNATLQQRINVATRELRASNNQLKHLDQIKDEFISMASHQLRTPLTSVKGYLSMVLDGDAGSVTPKQQKLLLEAYNSSERMARLIADFLNVSRLQTGKFVLEKEPIDIKEIVKQEADNLELIAKTRKIKFRLKIADDDMPLIADGAKIQQVVMNFIDNAIYYSHQNSTVIIKLERLKNSVAFTVVDTGIGVAEADQPKLFHKFYRAKNARKQRPDGTGVGLFMARRVIEEHGGKIIFSSREGKGSTFGFKLPLAAEELT